MKFLHRKFIYLAVLLFTVSTPMTVKAQSEVAYPEEPYSGEVLCTPGVYLFEQDECLPMGPSEVLTEYAKKGITFPLPDLPATHPSTSLNDLDVKYAKINLDSSESVKIFSSLDAAVDGSGAGRTIPGGKTRYISYISQVDVNGGHYLQIDGGEWLRASPADYETFQGLEFSKNPEYNVGWIVEETKPRYAPSYQAKEYNTSLPRETIIQVFDVVDAEDTQWFMIGLNKWVDRYYVRQVDVNTTPPEGVDNNRWIEINLYEQTLAVYENGNLLFATWIATGAEPYFTQPGLFQIYEKLPLETMTGAFEADKSDYYYLEDVPWTMYFDQSRALHGAYWHAWFGYRQSHGCVNLSIGDSHWIYNWANVGDYVYVWDPSGQTPTDPEFYTQGGA